MPRTIRTTSELLRKRLRELYEELAVAAPETMKEVRMIEGMLNAVGLEPPKTYSQFTSPWDAIEMCLNTHGDWKFTKSEMAEEIISGGYMASTPNTSRYLIKDSINYHIRKGALVLKNEKVGRK